MLVYCTYCSAQKNYFKIPKSAYQVYASDRINSVFDQAKKSGVSFKILSGKYGLIDANMEIAYYDHLLNESEIERHSDLIASQILSEKITVIEFYTNQIKNDENLQPYLNCIKLACKKALVELKINFGDFYD